MSQHLGPNDFNILSDKMVFQSEIQVKQAVVRYKCFKGEWIQTPRNYVSRPIRVAVLPYDPYQDKVVFLEHFRIGSLHQPEGPWHMEIPTSQVHPGETLEQAANRAISQGTNYEALDLEFIGDFFTSPSMSNEKLHLYACGIDASNIEGIHNPNDQENEAWIECLTLSEAIDAIYGNYFHDAATIMALHWLNTNKVRLQKKWQ